MAIRDEPTVIETDPALLELQAGTTGAAPAPVNVPQVGAVHSIAGLLGPDILIVVTANTISFSAGGATLTFGLASLARTDIFDANTELRVANTKVVGARDTGWTAATGTANKGAYATYTGQDVSMLYTETEVQQIDDKLKEASQRIKALEDALRAHGLIN